MSGVAHIAGFRGPRRGDPPDGGGCQLHERFADPVEIADVVVPLPSGESSLVTVAVAPAEAGRGAW